MANHENPKRNPIAESFKFNCKIAETMKAILSIWQNSEDWVSIVNALEHILRDKLVCDVKHDGNQQRLLCKGIDLILQKALEISLFVEPAIKLSAVL